MLSQVWQSLAPVTPAHSWLTQEDYSEFTDKLAAPYFKKYKMKKKKANCILITSLVTYHEQGKWTPSLNKVNSFDGIEPNDRLRTSVIDIGEVPTLTLPSQQMAFTSCMLHTYSWENRNQINKILHILYTGYASNFIIFLLLYMPFLCAKL